ncbi:hypothetical protein IE81DRAFT_319809 [Ceraceosorus guamensis]|uniref:Adenylyl cyclase-associated protein n=1 Tax=Ceraceosorus guamensis TaxID=1522189 RepID=A0A316W7W6_9BASI|nr:hypothetical protein IE81DRAFT_319809 [Ceraceosorus guamensis]PWN45959.1 hypothetical protein IE81DRAFT_319809 [Ceraceosorus guamensis]
MASGIGNLSTLLKRLEAATSRLEDIAVAQAQGVTASVSGGPSAAGHSGVAASAPAAAAAAPVEEPAVIEAYNETVAPALKKYVDLSAKLGGPVHEQAKCLAAGFEAQKHLIHLASASKKPPGGSPTTGPGPGFVALLKPLQTELIATTEVRDQKRGDKALFNHLSTVAEGAPALGWVTIEPKPAPYVISTKESAEFYSNRVIKEHKDDADRTHVEWTRSFVALLSALAAYVKEHHTTGLAWNPRGGDAEAFASPSSAPAAPAAPPAPPAPPSGGPPPPPPPPPAGLPPAPVAAGGMDAVFSQLNQGEGITSGLKKVDRSQMTHKNPELRASAPAPASGSKPTPPKPGVKPASFRQKKPARTELEGNKWSVENHEDNREIVIDATELNQTVNIFGCKNSTIQIRGKINAVSMVSCQKTSILLDTLVSALEITSSPSFAVQVTGRTPTILIDSCDSGQIYLSAEGSDSEIVTSKCSAINVSVPVEGGEEGELKEFALPEQLRHGFKTGKIHTEVVAHTG